MIPILIAASFSLGFFVESIVGFGAGLVAYAILSFFMDNIKQMILAGLYIGTLSSLAIALSDLSSFKAKNFFPRLPFCIIGVIIGVLIFNKISPHALALAFGILLIAIVVKMIFFDNYRFPIILRNKLLLIGGISQGMFGVGGPFIVAALQSDFKNKSHIRTTLAVFFVLLNIIRLVQLQISGGLDLLLLKQIWWSIIPIAICIKLGHKVHLLISEEVFKKLMAVIILLSGIKFLLY